MPDLDALDTAAIGEAVREAAQDSFWGWFEEPCDGVPAPPRDSDEARRAFAEFTTWLNDPDARQLGERFLNELERHGFEVRCSRG